MPAKLLLLDANSLAHRAFHALPKDFSTSSGEPTNALYGFALSLITLLDERRPKYVAAAFDLEGPTFRHEKYEEYKATRVKPDDIEILYEQIPKIKEMVKLFGVKVLEKEGYEADDVIGTICRQAEEAFHGENNGKFGSDGVSGVFIVTGDNDALQLVSDHVKVLMPKSGVKNLKEMAEEEVALKYGGLRPSQLVDYKALRGDPSDNIPGVSGIGDKGATELLLKFGDLDGVYAHIDEIKGSRSEKLILDKEKAYLSRELAQIHKDVPISFVPSDGLLKGIDYGPLKQFFETHEFTSLLKRLNVLESHYSLVQDSLF